MKGKKIIACLLILLLAGCSQAELQTSQDAVSSQTTANIQEESQEEGGNTDIPAPDEDDENEQASPESEILSVDEILKSPSEYENQRVSVQGILPQAVLMDESGNMICVLWNDDLSQYIKLDGNLPDFGSAQAVLTGSIQLDDGTVVLNVQSSRQVQE